MGNSDIMDMPTYIAKMRELAAIAAEQAIVPAANEMLAEVKNRIILDGENTQGSQIGQYSTKSAYFGREAFDKKGAFKPQGKNGKNKNAKTMYIPTGYRGLRDVQGKPSDKMNINYTGSTMAAYQQTVNDTEVLQGLTTERAALIRKGQEAKRGNIFAPTQEELANFNRNVAAQIGEMQLKILSV